MKIVLKRQYVCKIYDCKNTLRNIRGYLRKKRAESHTFKKGTKCFQLINFSHSKCSEIAFPMLSRRLKLE